MAEAMRNTAAAAAPLRPVRLGPSDVELERRPDGTLYLRSPHPLGRYPGRLTERLEHWAAAATARGAKSIMPARCRKCAASRRHCWNESFLGNGRSRFSRATTLSTQYSA